MNCPICNKELKPSDTFCPTCGFEIHIMPTDVGDAVKKYENSRIENYKKIWGTLEEGQGIKGFLVVMTDEEMLTGTSRRVKDIFPVYQGKNVFGKKPQSESDIHTQRIMYCQEIQADHFLIEGKADNSFIIQSVSGTSYLRNKANLLNNKETNLYNGDEIFIGNLIFVFISK